MRDPLVLAALATAVGGISTATVAGLIQRSGKRIDAREVAREVAATRAIADADRAGEQLKEAQAALVGVKDAHIAMLEADVTRLRAQVADLAAKVAVAEARPRRRDDGCVD